MITMASQITSLAVVYSTVYSDADQRKHQSSASLAFVWGIHRDRWIPRTKGQLRGKCFHLMTSSCDSNNNPDGAMYASTHLSLDKIAAISQTTFSNAFRWMKKGRISIKISLKFVPMGPIIHILALVQIMAWRWLGAKPLSEPTLAQFNDVYMRHQGG